MSSVSPLVFAQRCLIRYGMTTYLTIGNIGLLLNIITFSQHSFRQRPYSIYILATSICGCIGLNIAVIPYIYSVHHSNYFANFLVYCRVQFYFRHAFNQMMRTFIVIACADRYAVCSDEARIRALSQYQIAIRVVPSVIIFWLIVALLPSMLYSITDDGVCDTAFGVNNIFYSVYLIIALCIFPLVSMTTFEILIITNLKRMRARIQPNRTIELRGHVLRKRDRDMIKMLLIELILYICTTIPLTVVVIYKAIAGADIYTFQREQIEAFIFFLLRTFIIYINNCLSFWSKLENCL
ncbi:hypothetical protein I4U23_019859 [Adineta vaga]|nr:hypothetical protein I4U23_019859 [Adineta vaga]